MRLLGKHKFPHDAEALRWLSAWGAEIKDAVWKEPADVLWQFPHAINVQTDLFVFDVGSTGLEVEVSICFLHQIALINEIRRQVN